MQQNPDLNVQSGDPVHIFTFTHGKETLQFATPGKTPADAADKLVKMLHDLVIQIRVQYPQQPVPQQSSGKSSAGEKGL